MFNHAKNTDLNLRAKLLADKHIKQSAAINATVPSAPTPTFKILLLDKICAISKKILLGCVFILSGIFNKVNTHRATAEE